MAHDSAGRKYQQGTPQTAQAVLDYHKQMMDQFDVDTDTGVDDLVYVLYLQTESGQQIGPLMLELDSINLGLPLADGSFGDFTPAGREKL